MSDLDAYLRCLSHRHRRFLLYSLRDREAATVEDLVTEIRRRGIDSDGTSPPERSAVAVALRHRHLPKLEALSLVDYDPRSGSVVAGDIPAEVETLLDATSNLERN